MPFLDWVNKNQAKKQAGDVPYRLLDFQEQHGDAGAGDNLLIQGDNLEALKALVPFYAGRVKCIYIDPPYNTQSAFAEYDDKLEHSQWLSLMYPRLEALKALLAEDGSLWVQLDDNEAHYAKALLDEIYGRRNFIADVTWQKSYAVRSNAEFFSTSTEHLLIHCKKREFFHPNTLPRSEQQTARFENLDNDPRGAWQSITFTLSLMSGARGRQFAKTGKSENIYEVKSPSGAIFGPPPGRCWARTKPVFEQMNADGRIWWGPRGDRAPRQKMFLQEADEGIIPTTLWASGDDYGFNQDGIRELRALGLEFPTPKPEKLLRQIISIASNPGEIVFDSFLGSGTTAAVAHKMGRHYIGIEMGEHARTHCIPRLQKVIEGEQGGISEMVNWKGGGGFRFYALGDTVFLADGNINPKVRFKALAGYVWHFETGQPAALDFKSPFLGTHAGIAYYLLYNGILGDQRPNGGNVLTQAVLSELVKRLPKNTKYSKRVIYGEKTLLSDRRLAAEKIVFKQIPYDIKAR